MTAGITEREPIPALPRVTERRRLREMFGVTQAELAAELSVTRQTIVSWERAKKSGGTDPTGKNRVKYAEILAQWGERAKTRR